MITAVDTNIILDILIPGEPFSEPSKALLDSHVKSGRLIIGEVVYAELAAWFSLELELRAFLADTGIGLVYSSEKSLALAGTRWAEYTRRSRKNVFSCPKCAHSFEVACPRCAARLAKRLHVLADFLIGAHALVHADCVLSRDFGVYKTYFKDLRVMSPIPA